MENCAKKYGMSAFNFEVLELCSPDSLTCREQYWLDKIGCRVDDGGFNYREPTDNPNSRFPVKKSTKEKMSESKSFKYSAFGENLSLTKWAEKTGLNREAIRARINRGCSVEDAVSIPKKSTARNLSVLGFTGNIRELCDLVNTDYSRTKQRLNKGWCPTKAFLLPVQS